MAVTNRCLFPHDLNFAIQQLDTDLGNRLLANQQLMQDAVSSISGMDTLIDEGNVILDSLLLNNGAGTSTASSLTSSAAVATEYGLLPDNPTTKQQEQFLFNANIILFDGVCYMPGTTSSSITNAGKVADVENIEALRRLYFALGNDLDKTQTIIKTSTKTILVNNKMDIRILPSKGSTNGIAQTYTLTDVISMLQLNQLTDQDIAYTADGRTLVLTKSFLAIDQPSLIVMANSKVPSYQFLTNVFHLNGVDNSNAAISRYTDFGYTGSELNSILSGDDYVQDNGTSIDSTIATLKANASNIISILKFVQQRLSVSAWRTKLASSDLTEFYTQIDLALQKLIQDHQSLLTEILFLVSDYIESDIIDNLRAVHTDAKIKYLLEQRQEIKGLAFNPSDDDFLKYVDSALNATSPNSTAISNQYINNQQAGIYSQQTLLNMYAKLIDAQTSNTGTQTLASIATTIQALTDYIGLNPVNSATITLSIFQGQPSTATTSTILISELDVAKTMNFNQRINNVSKAYPDLYDIYPRSIAEPLIEVINAVTQLFEKVCAGIDTIIKQANNTLLRLKKRMDSWLSKHTSLTGGGSFNSSLLKCAVNWDIGISTDILDQLFSFLMKFVAQALAIITKIHSWVSHMLTNLVCMPANILNSFLGKLQVSLPSACRLPKFDLGPKLNTALKNLGNVCQLKTSILASFGTDLAKVKMIVTAAPDRLSQLKNSSVCDSPATSNFMNSSILNVNIGVKL